MADNGSDVEHYYYDGVRRVQTVVEKADPTPDETAAEYVYGPGYVDEFVLQMYKETDPAPSFETAWVVQDANYNVVALLDNTGQVIEQYVWEPYGSVLNVDTLANPPPPNRIGHQGLFFYRLDGNPASDPALAPAAAGLYYNRNRWYDPNLGRFTTRDPNESGLLVLSALARNGNKLSLLIGAFNAQGHFGNGMNLFARGNPIRGRDPLGLYDPFDEVDDWVDERIGNALYTLGELNEAATLGLQVSLEIASALLGLDVLESVVVLASGKGGFWDAMNIVLSVNPISRLGKATGKLAKAYKWMRKGNKGGRMSGKAAKHLFEIMPYRKAKNITRNHGDEIAAHHLLEARHARSWDLNPDDIEAVIIPRKMHEGITGRLFQEMPTYPKRVYTKAEVRRAYRKVYRELGCEEWLGHIEKYLR